MKRLTLTIILLLLAGCADMVTGLAGGSIPISLPPGGSAPRDSGGKLKLPLVDAAYNPEENVTYCYYHYNHALGVTLEGKVTCPEYQIL